MGVSLGSHGNLCNGWESIESMLECKGIPWGISMGIWIVWGYTGMICIKKMIGLEIGLSKNGVFFLNVTVHHRILGYASLKRTHEKGMSLEHVENP